ncbi:MAG: ABC transporter substrate-binding protein [Lautropia sp.]
MTADTRITAFRTDVARDARATPRTRRALLLGGPAAIGGAAIVGASVGPWVRIARAAGKPALEQPSLKLAVGGKAALYYLPLSIAEQRGYFRDEGLELEIVDFAGGSKALQAVVGGSAAVVSGAYEHTINLQARKQYFTAFVVQGRAPQISIGVAKAKAGSFKSAADLKGMKIGVSAPGSSTHLMATFFMAKAGLKPTDAAFIGVGTGQGAIAAVRSGQIDAISNTDPIMTMLERADGLKVVATSRTDKGTREVFGGPMPAACLYAPESWVKANPNTAQALANAIVRADKWLQSAGPSDIVKTVPESYLLGDRAVYLAAFENVRGAFSPDGLMPEGGPQTALKMLASAKPDLAKAGIDLARTYTNAFARKAASLKV